MASDGSDDDMPLAKSNGHVSKAKISKADDQALDASASKARPAPPGLSIRNGPIVDDDSMDVDAATNGTKRKSRSSLGKSVNYKDESESDGDAPLAKRQKSNQEAHADSDDEPISRNKNGKLPPSIKDTSVVDESDDDEPLGTKLAQRKASMEKSAAKEAKALQAKAKKATPKKAIKEESDEGHLAKPKKRMSNGVSASASKKANGVKKAESESDSDAPIAKKAKKPTPTSNKAKAKAAPSKKTPVKGKSATPKQEESEEPEDDEEEEGWWAQTQPLEEDSTVKWQTLEHNGPIFPDPYEPLPKHVKLYYEGKPLTLDIEAEEVAYHFGAMLHATNHIENPIFRKNFFNDFKEILKETGGAKDADGNKVDIKTLDKLDFKPIHEHCQALKAAQKRRTTAEKKADKAAIDAAREPYKWCIWNGKKERTGNVLVEPPGLFRGRGTHPLTGKYKKRVHPEQITINIGEDAKVPEPPAGHKWKAVQHDHKSSWLAMWQENIQKNYKYINMSAESSEKQQSDFKKFEKARSLKAHIDRIRKDYTKDLKSDVMADRQRATAMYLIDRFALRAGNEKDAEKEADTVGCCSLKYEHVTLREPNTVIFDFLGKDSIRFYNEVTVERQVFKNLKMFKKPPKEDGDDIFDRLTTTQLNKHLSSYMPGLTAKVFRTYNASWTFAKLLQEMKPNPKLTEAEKVKLFNDANREVAILCNHKRSVGAGHETQMEKLNDRIKGLNYQKWRSKMMMIDIDPKIKKKKGAGFFELDPDLDEKWILEHQAFLVEEERKKITKKFEKENEKRVAEKEKPLPEKELKERLKVANELEAKFKKENKTKKVEAEGRSPTIEKLENNIKKIEDRIRTFELQSADREENKEVALGTSKLNYIDPRLCVTFVNKFKIPLAKIFPSQHQKKFKWAIKLLGDDTTWEF